MAGRFARSWRLVKASAAVLSSDRKLLLFPVLSGLCTLVVSASFLLPVALSAGVFSPSHDFAFDPDANRLGWYAVMFVFYLVQYAITFFFNTALVGAAMMHLDGDSPTLGDGLRLAWSKWPQILGYAAIAATVGLLLRALQERVGWIGRWIVGLLGVAWTVATFLVVPVLAATDVGPVEAVKRSTQLLKRTWGENLIGNIGFGVVFGLAFILLAALLAGLLTLVVMAKSALLFGALIAVAVATFLLLAIIQSALQGVYAAALYRYAEHGDAGNHFEPVLLEEAFRARQQR